MSRTIFRFPFCLHCILLGEFYLALLVKKKTALLRIFSLTHLTECRRQVGNIADSYLGGPYFKSLSEDWKVLLMAFVIYLSIFRQISITQICVVSDAEGMFRKIVRNEIRAKAFCVATPC